MSSLPGASARTGKTSGAWYYILNRQATEQLLAESGLSTGGFDPSFVFTDEHRSSFEDIYRASGQTYGVQDYTATRVLEGQVNIRRAF